MNDQRLRRIAILRWVTHALEEKLRNPSEETSITTIACQYGARGKLTADEVQDCLHSSPLLYILGPIPVNDGPYPGWSSVLTKVDDNLPPPADPECVMTDTMRQLEKARGEIRALTEIARQHAGNEEFYHSIVVQIGEMFGEAAKTSDDGSVQQDVLALKVPELVEDLIQRGAGEP
jgi:hypothetical protein